MTIRQRSEQRAQAYPGTGSLYRDPLADRGLTGFRVGTVDKFQGREAPV